jgi:ADP-ribose pyrophosphatase
VSFERVGSEHIWSGRIATVRSDHFRHADGEVVEREIVSHPGAVAVVAHDDEHIWLVKQPREPIGDYLVELPAGTLDEEGEDVLATAKRELAEEIGKAAKTWVHLTTFWASPGFSDEQIHVYLATDLYDEQAHTDEVERIEIVKWPIDDVDELIRSNIDAKTLVGLLWWRAFESAAAPAAAASAEGGAAS